MTRPSTVRLLVAGAAAVLVVTGAVALRMDRDAPAAVPSAEQQGVRQAYLAYWDSLLAANADTAADRPALAAHAAGNQLSVVRAAVDRLRAQGVVARGPVGHAIRDVEIRPGLAYLVDCVDLHGWIQYEAASGAVRPGQLIDRPSQLARYTLARRDGEWLVTDSTTAGSC